MTENPTATERKTTVLLAVACVVSLMAAVGIARSVSTMLAPLEKSTAPAPMNEEQLDVREKVLNRMQREPWQPRHVEQRRRDRRFEKEVDELPFKVIGITGESADLKGRQMASLREDLEENANDDLSSTPTDADIAAMEEKGVMIW